MRKKREVTESFVQAFTDTLPKITSLMVASFFQQTQFLAPEFRNVKTIKSTRLDYSEQAIGFVEVRRDKKFCQVLADITAEQKVRTSYTVHVVVSEKKQEILKARCLGCPAKNGGGCKHAVAFITYLHRKSSEPPCTSSECLWKKSRLSGVGTKEKFLRIADIKKPKPVFETSAAEDKAFMRNVMQALAANKSPSLLLRHTLRRISYAVHHLLLAFKRANLKGGHSASAFVKFASSQMNEENLKQIMIETKAQANCKQWFNYRNSRITASKVYEASRCKTSNGSLVNQILGAQKIKKLQ